MVTLCRNAALFLWWSSLWMLLLPHTVLSPPLREVRLSLLPPSLCQAWALFLGRNPGQSQGSPFLFPLRDHCTCLPNDYSFVNHCLKYLINCLVVSGGGVNSVIVVSCWPETEVGSESFKILFLRGKDDLNRTKPLKI